MSRGKSLRGLFYVYWYKTIPMKKKRAQRIEKAIKATYASLESHLNWTHKKGQYGSRKFNQKCIKHYSKTLLLLSKLY